MAERLRLASPGGVLAAGALTIGFSACSTEPEQSSPALGAADENAPSSRAPSSTPPETSLELSWDRLSGTGLYAGGDVSAGLAPDVAEYSPRFQQWQDGATARRFLWLPPAASIDIADPDHWTYPVGTRAWQELSRDGRRIETRFMQKLGADDWRYLTFHWTTDADAVSIEGGLMDASGTPHDIPHLVDCGSCHDNAPDRLLGVSLLQLEHEDSGLDLDRLAADGRLGSPPEQRPELPGDATAVAALGYLHANCGCCHNPHSVEFRSVDLELWLPATPVASLEQTPVYRTAVGVERQGLGAGTRLPTLRIAPGAPEESAVYQRMASRDPNVQMPPIGTQSVDESGLASVAEWIRSVPPR
jgi:hypothetical protein